MTDRYAVIGHPVAHSKSPWIHAQFARATGQAMDYVAIEAPRDGFAPAVEAFRTGGGRGANVTLPFKEEAWRYSTRLSARARAARSVNTLKFEAQEIFGDNTDGAGLVRDLEANLSRSLAGARILLIGAGGAARGVLLPLLDVAPQRLVVANRTASKAESLVAEFAPLDRAARLAARGFDALAGEAFDLVINATSAGLTGDALPLPASVFGRGALAYDMVYGRDTAFLALARGAGVAAQDGLGMLVEQAAESFRLWRGVRPQTAPVLAALRAR